jgi:FAD/FMN-containing dehydrogenase
MTLEEVIALVLPRGFFPIVVPGTQKVTLGGMVAANVHGKNHHREGGFGHHILNLKLVGASGNEVTCGPEQNVELFRATIGGMGLTGFITEVTFRLRPVETAFIRQQTVTAPSLDDAMRILEESLGWTYAVAWIDCLHKGRALIFRGEHARRDELTGNEAANPLICCSRREWNVPFPAPSFFLNRPATALFNEIYYRHGAAKSGTHIVGWRPYFFPLDSVGHWNRLYGSRGFIQHQCVIPKANSRAAIGQMFELLSVKGSPSFLAVLKLMGPDEDGWMSFPLEGFTLAIDLPVNDTTMALASELDSIVARHGGRLYLAKDARQSRAMLEAGYPNLERFRRWRRASGSDAKFRSFLSERLGL